MKGDNGRDLQGGFEFLDGVEVGLAEELGVGATEFFEVCFAGLHTPRLAEAGAGFSDSSHSRLGSEERLSFLGGDEGLEKSLDGELILFIQGRNDADVLSDLGVEVGDVHRGRELGELAEG